mmetsp:Transcript_11895/g.25749  ORF Transcript_11895/g.25749 Transcript_11895/m.25749 type:complete len:318 (-) Transcript_11895:129-1082(-)
MTAVHVASSASTVFYVSLALATSVALYLVVAGDILGSNFRESTRLALLHINRSSTDDDDSNNVTSDNVLLELHSSPTSDYHFFQVGKHHTGSTLLANILWGLFDDTSDDDVDTVYSMHGYDPRIGRFGQSLNHGPDPRLNVTVVSKTHYTNIDHMIEEYASQFGHGVFFVVSNRGSERIDDKYCEGRSGDNYSSIVVCFEYDTFAYTCNSTAKEMIHGAGEDCDGREEAVRHVTKQIQSQLGYFSRVKFDIQRAVDRLRRMDETTESIKNFTFGYADPTYGVHGGHRNREPSRPSIRKGAKVRVVRGVQEGRVFVDQ